LTLIEMLVAGFLTLIALIAVANLLLTSWRSYDNIVWQNRVNQEARQALDDVCDALRMGGFPYDATWPIPRTNDSQRQVRQASNANRILFDKPAVARLGYQIPPASVNNPITYLARSGTGMPREAVAAFVTNVHFEYEYRVRATGDPNNAAWIYVRTNNPSDDQKFLINTVYVTVTTQSVYNGQTFARTLTSAVNMRTPYNRTVPLAQSNGTRP
jgi:Tfp pilus assembly protein PilW